METENLRLILEAIEQISTEIFFLIIIKIMEDFVTQMTYYIILMIFAYKCFSLIAAHLAFKRMGDQLGYQWPYSKSEKRRIYKVFERGIESDETLSRNGSPSYASGA